MLELYVRLVEVGKRTVESVPELFRADVEKAVLKTKEAGA
ncbi:CD1375 family protein [Lacrimispora sp.]|nr:CD1375 family protein [Lacrimispora sp.]